MVCRSAVSCMLTRLFMHAVKEDATRLLFTAVAHHILQMCSANCRNVNRFLEVENENDENIRESKKRESCYKPTLNVVWVSLS